MPKKAKAKNRRKTAKLRASLKRKTTRRRVRATGDKRRKLS